MMNMQNPALYPPQQAYAYGSGMAQPPQIPPAYSDELAQNQFQQQQQFPSTPQRTAQFPQPSSQIPPHLYQQLQQQQQAQQQQGGFGRPPSQGGGITQGQRQSPGNGQIPNSQRNTGPQPNNGQTANMMGVALQQAMGNTNQQVHGHNPSKSTSQPAPPAPASPQSMSREKARVAILLEINSNLLQELVTLQNQGKAGTVQQSPTSPNSTNENFNSPVDAGKAGPSMEFKECLRRLQANLSYLAAVADAKKRADGKVPPYPAILVAPAYLTTVHDLYKKLATLFPEANVNKSIGAANAQQNPSQSQSTADGQL